MSTTRRDAIIGRAFAIGAALAYAIGAVLIRKGLAGLTPPLVGATIGLSSGVLVLAVVGLGRPESNLRQKRRSVGFLALAGVAGGLAIATYYFALSMAPVVVVVPLINTSPLFALLWSHLFLGQLERITRRVVLGTILVVAGAILVSTGRMA